MARLTGYVKLEVDVDVDDDLLAPGADLEREQAFNDACWDAWQHGDLADYDYSVEED